MFIREIAVLVAWFKDIPENVISPVGLAPSARPSTVGGCMDWVEPEPAAGEAP